MTVPDVLSVDGVDGANYVDFVNVVDGVDGVVLKKNEDIILLTTLHCNSGVAHPRYSRYPTRSMKHIFLLKCQSIEDYKIFRTCTKH